MLRLRLTAVALLCLPFAGGSLAAPPSLIPLPAHIARGEGNFVLSSATAIACRDPHDPACAFVAGYLSDLLRRTVRHTIPQSADTAAITLTRAQDIGGEAYRLTVRPTGIEIAAGGDAGLFYGAVTLWQLATAQPVPDGGVTIPSVTIEDAPRFAWRGVLLDSARHYQPPDFVKRLIDVMALHKLNVLQWHLTDDQGWRLEIKQYPRLTGIGAFRRNRREGRYGGYYSQNEVRAIVAYAAQRHVTIVPEIEMPGHASAAIAAYPALASTRHPPKHVSGDWGVYPNLYNVDEATFTFLENVLSEVMALFPSPYIHVGGDEAPKAQWQASPRVQARMRALGIADAKALQGYFTARIGRFLEAHGRRLIGWDEILEGTPPADAAVMSWRTVESAGQAAARGHDVVLSPAPMLYLDYCQIVRQGEPTCRGLQTTLQNVYDFDPVAKGDLSGHLIGMQSNIWSEHLPSPEAIFYAAFPRLAAFAENAWSPPESHDWQGFLARLPAQLARYEALDVPHSEAAFVVAITAKDSPSGAVLDLANQTAFGTLRYTLDGTTPSLASPAYSGPFPVKLPVTVTATAFEDGRRLAAPTRIAVDAKGILRRNSYTMEPCSNDLPLAQKGRGGAVVMVNVMNPCWIYRGLDLSGISRFEFSVLSLPWNFRIGEDIKKIPLYPRAARQGQLEIHLDDCKGPRLAIMKLSAKAQRLESEIAPQTGVHDLCFLFARRTVDPIWALDWVQPLRQE